MCRVRQIGFIFLILLWFSTVIANEDSSGMLIDVPVYINGDRYGRGYVFVDEDGTSVEIHYQSFKQILEQALTENGLRQALEVIHCETINFKPFKSAEGISINFDESDQVLKIEVKPEWMKEKVTSFKTVYDQSLNKNVVPTADWSGYLNFLFGRRMPYSFFPSFQIFQNPTVGSTDFVLHHENWTLEGACNLGDQKETGRWLSRKNLVWMYDWPGKNYRLSIGDLSYPILGFQRGIPVLGISFNKNNRAFSYQSTKPISQYEFILKEQSRVDVIVNDTPFRTLDLPAGPQSLRDFPLLSGVNNVALRVVGASGREETINLEYIYDSQLLRPGDLQYSSSLGIPQNFLNSGYVWNRLLYSGYFLYGCTTNWNTGGYLQVDTEQTQIGIENSLSTRLIRTTLDVGTSWYYGATPQVRSRVVFSNMPPSKNTKNPLSWRGTLEYYGQKGEGSDVNPLSGYLNWENPIRAIASLSLTKRFPGGYNASFGSRYSWMRIGPSYYSMNLAVSKIFARQFSTSLTAYYATSQSLNTFEPEKSIVFRLTWIPPNSKFSTDTSYNSAWRNFDQTVNYTTQRGGEAFNISGGVRIQPHDQYTGIGNVSYQGERFEFAASNDLIQSMNEHAKERIHGISSATIGTSLVFADGVYSISRPIHNSFIMVKPRPWIAKYGVEVNPTGDGFYMARSFRGLPAVLSNVGPYQTQSVNVVSKRLPIGYELGPDFYSCTTKYKSGTLIEVGNKPSAFVEGVLMLGVDQPAGSRFGIFKKGEEEIPFFTSREGEFQIEKVQAGTYQIFLPEFKGPCATITIPPEAVPGIFDAGIIYIERTSP